MKNEHVLKLWKLDEKSAKLQIFAKKTSTVAHARAVFGQPHCGGAWGRVRAPDGAWFTRACL